MKTNFSFKWSLKSHFVICAKNNFETYQTKQPVYFRENQNSYGLANNLTAVFTSGPELKITELIPGHFLLKWRHTRKSNLC